MRVTNIPHKGDGRELDHVVEGENITLINRKPGGKWRDGDSVSVLSVTVGDHMLKDPEALRRMIARELEAAILGARDAGARQARIDIRRALGLDF